MKNCFIAIFFLVSSLVQAQRVGLVMSGGGAKGIAHIGLLQVLEDHNIPIDYITGTSMGAIVGSLYAMGYSPSEMMNLIKSDKFKYWQSGVIKEEDMIYYLKNEPTPEWVQFNINFRKDAPKKTQAYFIPASIVNPVQMNAAFLELYGQAGGASGYNFDNLFVPYRCVSADTYNKNTLVSKNGDLGMAVRASMTFPFVFSPIRINGNLMYDGGIYNNFPADIMLDEFNPDFMIGSSVTGTPNKPAERDIMGQLENMVMQKTDYSIPKEKGIYIRSHLKDYGIMDFEKADSIYQVGYNMGMQFLDSIQGKIKRRVPKESVELRRMIYKSKLPDLVFEKISINGVTSAQKEYIASQIRKNDNGTFTFESFQKDYYGLLSDDKITQIIPTAVYNPDTGYFELVMDITMKEAFSASVGGLISSMNSNEAFLGINYQSLSYYSMDYDLRAYLGNKYNSLELSTRIIFPSKYPFYLKFIGVTSSNKFFEKEKRLFDQNMQAFASKRETFAKLRLGIPFFRNGKIELSTGYGEMIDKYTQPVLSDFSLSTYQIWANALKAEKNTLNEHMYPDKGSRLTFIGQYIIENESYRKFAGEKRSENIGSDQWFQLSGDYECYNPIKEYFSLGFQVKSVISNKPLYNNYSATIIQAPAFTPTPHSKIALNESFRALSYAAGGIKPIYLINKNLHVRTEYYAFVPFINVKQGDNNASIKIKGIKNINHFGEISLVYNTPIGSISIFGNYYSEPKSNFNYGINIGILLGNSKLIE